MGVFGKKIEFSCTGCGACCRRVGKILPELKDKGIPFPYEAKEDGSCEMLGEDNKCKVYDNRPDICIVEKQYKKVWKPKGVSRKEAFLQEAKICNIFVEEDGLDDKYKVDENLYQ